MTVHYFSAASLDGFVATPDDSLDWLLSRDVDSAGPHGYDNFLQSQGAVVMGGTTFRWLQEHGSGSNDPWPYEMPSWVFTSRHQPNPPSKHIRFVTGQPSDHIAAIKDSAEGKDVWLVGGGQLAAQFAHAGLIDEVWVQFAPVFLGEGKPLLAVALELELDEVVRNGDFVCAHYLMAGDGRAAEL